MSDMQEDADAIADEAHAVFERAQLAFDRRDREEFDRLYEQHAALSAMYQRALTRPSQH